MTDSIQDPPAARRARRFGRVRWFAGLAILPGLAELVLGNHMAFPAYVFYAALTTPVVIWVFWGEPIRRRLALAVAYPAALVAVWFAMVPVLRSTVLTPHDVFRHELEKIQVGMTAVEAKSIMAEYVEGTGTDTAPGSAATRDPNPALLFRRKAGGGFAADWGVVSIRDGRVARVDLIRD